MKQHIALSGQFRIVKKSSDNQVLFDSGVLNNLLLDTGLDYFGDNTGSDNMLNFLAVGSGNSQPVITQNRLDNVIAIKNSSSSELQDDYNAERDGNFYTVSRTHKYSFDGLNNVNLSELGLVSTNNIRNYTAYTRALIKDDSGRPLTITVLQGEVLEVFYTLKQVFELKETQTTLALSDGRGGTRGLVTCRMKLFAVGKTLWDGYRYAQYVGTKLKSPFGGNKAKAYRSQELGEYTGEPKESASLIGSPSQVILGQYEPLSHKRTLTLEIAPNYDLPKLGALAIGSSMGYYQISFANQDGSMIDKNRTRTFSITLEISWGRDERN